MLKLQFKDTRRAAIWLVDPRYAIGSAADSDIVVKEEGIAQLHAELRVEPNDQIFITDAGSTTGTFVNDERITSRTPVKPGDLVRLNNFQFSLVDPKEQIGKGVPEDDSTSISPALQNLSVSNRPATGTGVGGVPEGWLLRGKAGSVVGERFPIPASGRAIVGRSQECDIVLSGGHVSRRHAELYFQSGRLHVKDLGSSNGTYVNRKKIQQAVINPGDEIRFDTLVFDLEAPEPPEVARDGEDSTQFRPAITTTAAAPAVAKTTASPAPASAAAPVTPPVSAAAASPAQKSAPASGKPAPPQPTPAGGGSVLVPIIVLVLIAAAGAGIWLFLNS